MGKNINDFIHFYLGGEVLMKSMGEEIVFKIISVSVNGGCFATGTSQDGKIVNWHGSLYGAKLLLRPEPIDYERGMTAREYGQYKRRCLWIRVGLASVMTDTPESFQWLIKNKFDVFGLIKSGLAIDRTKQLSK